MIIDINSAARNIRKVLASASDAERESGMAWYRTAHEIAAEIAPTAEIGAGVIAALSPQTSWDQNVVIARRIMSTGVLSGHTGANLRKAERIMAGEDPLDVLGGLKVRSFYRNILTPDVASTVTIDRHAFDIGLGLRTYSGKDRVGITPKRYEALSAAYARVAGQNGMLPHELQAVTWEAWRNVWAWKRAS